MRPCSRDCAPPLRALVARVSVGVDEVLVPRLLVEVPQVCRLQDVVKPGFGGESLGSKRSNGDRSARREDCGERPEGDGERGGMVAGMVGVRFGMRCSSLLPFYMVGLKRMLHF